MSLKHFSRQRLALYVLLGLGFLLLVWESNAIFPTLLQVWKPFDYGTYVAMGRAVRQGINPYGPNQYYPLPTILWIFVPLSFMPNWFYMVWIWGSFISLVYLFRRGGILTAVLAVLYTPFWYVFGDAMLDGWLLIPMVWLLEDRPILAGLGATIVLFKPQLAWLVVIYMFFKWIASHNWQNLSVFCGTLALCYIPSFIIDPNWPIRLLAILPDRAAQTTTMFPLLAGSLWSWLWLNNWGLGIFGILLAVTLILFRRATACPDNRAAASHLLNLILNPIFYGTSMIMVVPVLRERKHILISIAVSLGAFGLDQLMGGFGGGYALLPFFALYWLATRGSPSPASERPSL